ncbi:MAG: aspartate-semialdehyde dehydrogenase [Bacteroidetes bacterium]|nr:aspartate-semialdehyde dehydrogenase [Bacteroidota bacterium]
MYKVAIIGATGLVGSKMLEVLAERNFPVSELIVAASENSVGKNIMYRNKSYTLVSVQAAVDAKPQIAIFSAGGSTSLAWAEKFAANGTFVIDNSSAWRMNEKCPLVVPEINAATITSATKIIANPNCSTIQMVVALADLNHKFKINRIVVSTYQSVTGTGMKAVKQLMDERNKIESDKVYPHQIDLNLLPQIDTFLENGYTKEEMKMVHETQKILGDQNIKVTATCVRVPVMGGHSESVNVSFENEFDIREVRSILQKTKGVIVTDDIATLQYPMPLHAHEKDEVFVGRIRRDETQPKTLNLWIVSDNLRKGAATNAIQIAEYLAQVHLI